MDDGLDFVGADAEDRGEATELPASPGPNKVDGLDIVGAVAEDHSEVMEFPTSPRSPLCFFPEEATVLSASPRTPHSSSHIPDFSLLVTPPLLPLMDKSGWSIVGLLEAVAQGQHLVFVGLLAVSI